MDVKLEVVVQSITKTQSYEKNADGTNKTNTEIKMYLGYSNDPKHPNYPYARLSGGSTFTLNTINEEAAAEFNLGQTIEVLMTPKV